MPALHPGVGSDRGADLFGWRYQYLTRSGLAPAWAFIVAGALHWDLHALLERGCPPLLAARSLAPADDQEI